MHRILEKDWAAISRQISKAYHEGRLAKAEDLCWEALSKAKLMGEFEPRLAISLSNLAVIQRLRGQYARAEDLSNIALRITQAIEEGSPMMVKALVNAACFFHDEGRWGEARRLYGKAIAWLEEGRGDKDLLCQALLLHARLCSDQGRDSQAETIINRVSSLGPETVVRRIHWGLTSATVALRQDRLNRCESSLEATRAALDERPELVSVWRSSMLVLRARLGEAALQVASRLSDGKGDAFLQRRAVILGAYEEASTLREEALGAFHPACGEVHRQLGSFYLTLQDPIRAEPLLRKALMIALSARGPYHVETLRCLETSLDMLRLAGRYDEAGELEVRVSQVEKSVRDRARETFVIWGES